MKKHPAPGITERLDEVYSKEEARLDPVVHELQLRSARIAGGDIPQPMHKRMIVTLPEETLRMIDRAAGRGGRSRLIDEAVRYFVRRKSRRRIRTLLAEGAKARRKRDRVIADE